MEAQDAEARIQQNEIEDLINIRTENGAMQQQTIPTRCLQSMLSTVQNNSISATQINTEAVFWEQFDTDLMNVDIGTLGETQEEIQRRIEVDLDNKLGRWGVWSDVGNEDESDDGLDEIRLNNEPEDDQSKVQYTVSCSGEYQILLIKLPLTYH